MVSPANSHQSHPYSPLNCLQFFTIALAGESADRTIAKTFLGHSSSQLTINPSFSRLAHSSTNGFKNVFIAGFLSPNHKPFSNTCFPHKCGGSSFIELWIGQIEKRDDSKTGIPSVFHIRDKSLFEKLCCSTSSRYNEDDVASEMTLFALFLEILLQVKYLFNFSSENRFLS